jgi:NAD+ diphosphatase
MFSALPKFCPQCAAPLALKTQLEDSGPKERLRCTACDFTHWNNPTPVLAAVLEYQGQVLLAWNAAWPERRFRLITGFMEANESPSEGVAREVKEETNLDAQSVELIGVYEFMRMNQVIIAYHVQATGEVKLSGELREYKLFALDQLKYWPAGTGYALADWLRSRGHEPQPIDISQDLAALDRLHAAKS